MTPEDREFAYDAALRAAALAPVRNRQESMMVLHMLTNMDVLQHAVDAALDVLEERGYVRMYKSNHS